MILLDIITTRTNVHIPKTATGRDSTATVTPIASQIAKFKSKAIHTYILNLYEGTLQLQIGNNSIKIK